MSEIFTYNPDISYTERPENDFYQTPINLCIAALEYLKFDSSDILDTGVGTGSWGKAVRKVYGQKVFLSGVEIDKAFNTPENFTTYDQIAFTDYLNLTEIDLKPFYKWKYIIGNPPYGKSNGEKGKFAEKFIRKSANLLEPEGFIMYLLKASFRHGKDRNLNLFKEIPIYDYIPLAERPSFKSGLDRKTGKIRKGGTDATEYALFIFYKDISGNFVDGGYPSLIWKD